MVKLNLILYSFQLHFSRQIVLRSIALKLGSLYRWTFSKRFTFFNFQFSRIYPQLRKIKNILTVEWQSRPNVLKLFSSVNSWDKRFKILLKSFEDLNYGLNPLNSKKIKYFKDQKCLDDSIKSVFLGLLTIVVRVLR